MRGRASQRGGQQRHTSAVKVDEVQLEDDWTWDRWCNSAPLWEDLECYSSSYLFSLLAILYQQKIYYMHPPCLTPATRSRALSWGKPLCGFSPLSLDTLKSPSLRPLTRSLLVYGEEPAASKFHVSQQKKSNSGAKSLSGRESGRRDSTGRLV